MSNRMIVCIVQVRLRISQ